MTRSKKLLVRRVVVNEEVVNEEKWICTIGVIYNKLERSHRHESITYLRRITYNGWMVKVRLQ